MEKHVACRPDLGNPPVKPSSPENPVWIWTDGSADPHRIIKDSSLA